MLTSVAKFVGDMLFVTFAIVVAAVLLGIAVWSATYLLYLFAGVLP